MYKNIITKQKILDKLDEYDKIFFGPFVGSYTYEIYYWSGFVRWYINNNPDKEYIICTRKDRKGLYDCDLNFELIQILNENNIYTFDYTYKGSSLEDISGFYKEKYPEFLIFNTDDLNNDNSVFIDDDIQDFNILTSEADKNIINKIIRKHKELIPICIFPKINEETNHYQCWNPSNWNSLLDGLVSTTNFLIFNIGVGDNYFRSSNKLFVYNLEDYYSEEMNTSITGMAVEAIKNSKFCVSTTNANIVLSMVLEKDCIIWGHENHEFVEEFNIDSNITGFTSRKYSLNPFVVYEEIKNRIKQIKK